MSDPLEDLRKQMLALFRGESDDEESYRHLINAIEQLPMMGASDEVRITANTLKKVFLWMTQMEERAWDDIKKGTHPELKELVFVLNEKRSTQKEIVPSKPDVNSEPFAATNGEKTITKGDDDVGKPDVNSEPFAATSGEKTITKGAKGDGIASKSALNSEPFAATNGEKTITNGDDVVGKPDVNSEPFAATNGEKTITNGDDVVGKPDVNSEPFAATSGEKTITNGDGVASKSALNSEPFAATNGEKTITKGDDVVGKSVVNSEPFAATDTGKPKELDKTNYSSEIIPEGKQILDFDLDDDCNEIVPLSQNEIEKCLNTIGEKESALPKEGVVSSDDETQDPTESDNPPQRRNVDDFLRDSQVILRNLAKANKELKEVVKDPYHHHNSDDEVEKNHDKPSRCEKRKKFLAPQKGAIQLTWDENDSDSSFDDVQPVVKKGVAVKQKKKHRSPWSQDEMDFIRDGIRVFGVGDWAGIRDHYPFKSEHRNSTKIKDKYRNMVKNGLIVQY